MNRSLYLHRCPARGAVHTATGIRTPETLPLETWARSISLYAKDGTIRAFAMVDPEDHERLAGWRWCVREVGRRRYVVRVFREGGKWRRLLLHREIMGLGAGDPRRVDHVNRDTLDNRRSNLRVCTDAENAQNLAPRPGSSRYRGVCWVTSKRRWKASHWLAGRLHHIGYFTDEDEAGAAAAAWRAENMPFSDEARAA